MYTMIAIGCDHGGFVLKQEIMKFLESAGYEYEDLSLIHISEPTRP